MTQQLDENPTESNLVAHAIRELDLIGETSYEEPSMRKCVLDVVRLVSEQGHSGFTAVYLIAVVEKLLRFQPLSPITNREQDWMEVGEGVWQCVRDPEAFSSDHGQTYERLSERGVRHRAAEWGAW